MTVLIIALCPSRMDIYMKYGQTKLTWGEMIFLVENPWKAEFIIQVNPVCPFHCPIYTVLAYDNAQAVFCTFLCVHIGMRLIVVFNCHIFERTTYLLVNVRADKVLCIRRLSSHCQSNLSHVRIHSVVSICLFARWSEQSLVQSHVDKKRLLDQFGEHPVHKGQFRENHERRRYYVEILYTSVSRLCPRRQFVSWNLWIRLFFTTNWTKSN